jgi:hypothetical protein
VYASTEVLLLLGLRPTYSLTSPLTCGDQVSRISNCVFKLGSGFATKKERFCRKTFSVKFESHKLLKAVFDATRCALSNETNPDKIHRADMTNLLDLGEQVFLGW